jgi:hypothetical protein
VQHRRPGSYPDVFIVVEYAIAGGETAPWTVEPTIESILSPP